MIDMKQAVQIAREKAAEILNQPMSSLEEIERETYKGRDAWSITLSVQPDPDSSSPFELAMLYYKRFLIDAETGEFLAMKVSRSRLAMNSAAAAGLLIDTNLLSAHGWRCEPQPHRDIQENAPVFEG